MNAELGKFCFCSIEIFLNHLNISLMNHFLRNGIRITLQWPREPGAVYDVNVLPFTQVTNVMSHNSIMINLTISYNIQYELNISISSSLCSDITTTRVLKYGRLRLNSKVYYYNMFCTPTACSKLWSTITIVASPCYYGHWISGLPSPRGTDHHIHLSTWICTDWPGCISMYWEWRMGTRPWRGGLQR